MIGCIPPLETAGDRTRANDLILNYESSIKNVKIKFVYPVHCNIFVNSSGTGVPREMSDIYNYASKKILKTVFYSITFIFFFV